MGSYEMNQVIQKVVRAIETIKDGVCKRIEELLAPTVTDQPNQAKLRINILRRYDVLPQQKLSSEDEIDRYVAMLKDKLMEALKDHDAIQLN